MDNGGSQGEKGFRLASSIHSLNSECCCLVTEVRERSENDIEWLDSVDEGIRGAGKESNTSSVFLPGSEHSSSFDEHGGTRGSSFDEQVPISVRFCHFLQKTSKPKFQLFLLDAFDTRKNKKPVQPRNPRK